MEPDWKRAAKDDFARWLDELPPGSEPPPPAAAAPTVDLKTLLGELAALRQELKLQNREQGRAVRELERAKEQTDGLERSLGDAAEGLRALAERERSATERRCLEPMLGVRDALERGLAASRRVAAGGGFFRRPPAGITGVVAGYEMALTHFDGTIERLGVRRVTTLGQPFDPLTMRAVDVRDAGRDEAGRVVEERVTGFRQGESVLRTAEVVVGKGAHNHEGEEPS